MKRLCTSGFRALPDYLVIGAQKAGTSSLYSYLTRHPDVEPAFEKEVHYFDLAHGKPLLWYRASFPLRSTMQDHRAKITGEASPDYLYHPLCASRIRAAVPDARLVVLLRDPVARAYSHYHHEKARGREPLGSFQEAVLAEPSRLNGDAHEGPANGEPYTEGHRRHSYLDRGRYADQLRRYFQEFPRDRVLVLFFEEFIADPQAGYSRVLAFLGLPDHRLEEVRAKNVGSYDQKADIPLEDELREAFASSNEDLRTLLGVPLPWP